MSTEELGGARTGEDPGSIDREGASTERETESTTLVGRIRTNRWASGAIAGFIGGVLFGTLLQNSGALPAIGSLYGFETATAGCVAHLFHSVAFGLAFVALVTAEPVSRYVRRSAAYVAAGLAYGVVVWFVAAGIVMPLWLGAVGAMAPPVPNLDATSLVGHLIYGGVLGGLYHVIGPSRELSGVQGTIRPA